MRAKLAILVMILVLASPFSLAYRCPLHVTEGETIRLSPEGYDPDSDSLTWIYPDYFDSFGIWNTTLGTAGVYHFSIGLTDGEFTDWHKTCLEVFPLYDVNIKPKTEFEENQKPILKGVTNVLMNVGDKLNLKFSCEDPDGDSVQIRYNGWPGKLKHTAISSDAGVHLATVSCVDSRGARVEETMIIEVNKKSLAPSILLDRIVVNEGDIIDLRNYVTDADSDIITYHATGPFSKSLMWKTKTGDAGTYDTILSVSDGENLQSKAVTVVVLKAVKLSFEINYDSSMQFETSAKETSDSCEGGCCRKPRPSRQIKDAGFASVY